MGGWARWIRLGWISVASLRIVVFFRAEDRVVAHGPSAFVGAAGIPCWTGTVVFGLGRLN